MTEEKLRESIRQAIRIVKKKKLMAENQATQDELTLREVVRKFISA